MCPPYHVRRRPGRRPPSGCRRRHRMVPGRGRRAAPFAAPDPHARHPPGAARHAAPVTEVSWSTCAPASSQRRPGSGRARIGAGRRAQARQGSRADGHGHRVAALIVEQHLVDGWRPGLDHLVQRSPSRQLHDAGTHQTVRGSKHGVATVCTAVHERHLDARPGEQQCRGCASYSAANHDDVIRRSSSASVRNAWIDRAGREVRDNGLRVMPCAVDHQESRRCWKRCPTTYTPSAAVTPRYWPMVPPATLVDRQPQPPEVCPVAGCGSHTVEMPAAARSRVRPVVRADRRGAQSGRSLGGEPGGVDVRVDRVQEPVHAVIRAATSRRGRLESGRPAPVDRLQPSDKLNSARLESSQIHLVRRARGWAASDQLQRCLARPRAGSRNSSIVRASRPVRSSHQNVSIPR